MGNTDRSPVALRLFQWPHGKLPMALSCTATGACFRAFATPSARRASAAVHVSSAQQPSSGSGAGGSRLRRGVLQLLASGAAAGFMGTRSVAAAAAVDEAEQVRQCGRCSAVAQALGAGAEGPLRARSPAQRPGQWRPPVPGWLCQLPRAVEPIALSPQANLSCNAALPQVLLDPQWPEKFPFRPEFFQRSVLSAAAILGGGAAAAAMLQLLLLLV